jgi:hypothetical protein
MVRTKQRGQRYLTREVTKEEFSRLEEELQAARKRLDGPRQKLRWFLEFVATALETQSPTERAVHSYNLWAAAGASVDRWGKRTRTESLPLKTLQRIQAGMRVALRDLFSDTADWSVRGPEQIGLYRTSPLGAKETTFEFFAWTDKNDDFAWHGFINTLAQGGKYLRTCTRCHKPFVPNKRQEYCGPTCSQASRNETKKKMRQSGQLKT